MKRSNYNSFFSNSGCLWLEEKLIEDNNKQIEEKEAWLDKLEAKDLANPPIKELLPYINTISSIASTRFSINPSLAEASASLQSTLSSKLLDLSVVRAEVSILCFEKLINIQIPVHVFLLANRESDFKIVAPSVRTFVRQLRIKKLFKFKRRFFRPKLKALKFKRRLLFFFLTVHQFYKIFFKRTFGLTSDDEDTFILLNGSMLDSKVRCEVGIIRSLYLSLLREETEEETEEALEEERLEKIKNKRR
jgi:hypothetical protein